MPRIPIVARLAALPFLLLALAGCGADGAGGGGAPSATAAAATGQAEAVRFAECLRGHGVPDFPDPDAKGEFDYGVSVPARTWRAAVQACKALQPPGALSSKRDKGQQSAALRFAACMRRNGVEDFPDPVDGEPLINTYKIPSSNRPGGMAVLNAAIDRCRAVGDEALGR